VLNKNGRTDADVSGLTRKFLLAFSHWVFYFILLTFFFYPYTSFIEAITVFHGTTDLYATID
jgi:hypothetical protein